MKYPKFLYNNSTIGVTAMAAVVDRGEEQFDLSIDTIKQRGFNVVETKNVRGNSFFNSPGRSRADEFNELIINNDVDAIMCASGGDFCLEILPYINEENIKNNVKWVIGSSDPTSVLFYMTTKLDIATLYGYNAGSFDQLHLHESCKIFFDYFY